MAYTQVQICNLALRRMSSSANIQSIDEASQEAYNCNEFYEPSLRAALAAFPWDFAREIATLALLAETPADYEYAYSLPSGCVRPLYILPEQDPAIKFSIRGQTVYTDEEDAVLAYTQYVDVAAYYPDNFVEAFTYRLASDLAMPLKSDMELQSRMMQMAERAVATAKTSDARQGKRQSSRYSDIVNARA